MRSRTIHDAFFQGDALLLVEDSLTRRVLAKCWESHPKARRILLREAGGREGVRSLVQSARENGRTEVFGLVDRDFDATPGPGTGPVFRTERHEIENHILDFNVLTRLSGSLTAQEIRDIAHARAVAGQTWMALRRTLFEMKHELPGFPADPKFNEVPNVATAENWLDRLPYPANIESLIRRTWTKDHLKKIARDRDHACGLELASASDQWIETFSGKEILTYVREKVLWRHPINTADDLAFEVADRWSRAGMFPSFIDALRDAIITRGGL
jgi:hypothetical protein